MRTETAERVHEYVVDKARHEQSQSFAADLEAERERRRNGSGPTDPTTSWAPVDLGAVIRDGCLDEPPQLLARTDGPCLIYAGKNHVFSGEPESCKGWAALHASAERVRAGEHVLYLDFEDVAATVIPRLLALGLDEQELVERFHYVQPSEPLEAAAWSDLEPALATEPSLAVIDGVTEALVLHGLDLKDNSDVAKWLALLPRRLTNAGIAVVQIDHVGRDREARGRFALGAQHKLAGVDVHYAFDILEPFGRGLEGRIKVTVSKDRPGHVRRHADEAGRVAELRLTSEPDGAVSIDAMPPRAIGGGAPFRPTALIERTSRAVEDSPGLSKNAIEATVRGKTDYKRLALELLIADGFMRVERDGQAGRHYSVRPFRGGEQE